MKSLRKIRRNLANSVHQIEAALRGNGVRAFWYDAVPNFGDRITPWLLRHFGFTPIHAAPDRAEIVGTGSVLQWVPPSFTGTILGSGLIRPVEGLRFPDATVLALRGPLTRQAIDVPDDVPLGDPGLLAPLALSERSAKRWTLGLVPHYADRDDPRIARIASAHPDVRVIDVRRPPREVFAAIDACRAVLSSSLHGLVTADALGIPAAWMELSDRVVGKGFKFRDHHAAVDVEREPQTIEGDEAPADLSALAVRAPHKLVRERQETLSRLFQRLRETIQSDG